jgi:ketosteroid isomerase-like protein
LRVDAELGAANERLDLEGFLSHLAEDFVMAKEGAIMPLDEFSEHLAESFSNYDHHVIESEPAKVTVLTPAAVVVTSSLDWVAVNPEGETVWDGPLAWTAVYEKRAGVWKLTHGHLSWASQ